MTTPGEQGQILGASTLLSQLGDEPGSDLVALLLDCALEGCAT